MIMQVKFDACFPLIVGTIMYGSSNMKSMKCTHEIKIDAGQTDNYRKHNWDVKMSWFALESEYIQFQSDEHFCI